MTRPALLLATAVLALGLGWRFGFKAGADLATSSVVVREVAPAACADLAGAVVEVIEASSMYPPLIPRAIEADTASELDWIVKRMRKATAKLDRATPAIITAAEGCSRGGTA